MGDEMKGGRLLRVGAVERNAIRARVFNQEVTDNYAAPLKKS